ncbi:MULTISPECIES: MFS transporter [Micrococcales]|uniref:MFS transporter n=1 Tax=Micrococcales TaxID=85006 RepID=UPI0005626104|nr:MULTISPECIES: MFS transporter [Micrococcales]
MSSSSAADTAVQPGKSPGRAAFAGWIGSALEYYDFAVYATAAAVVLNHIFFPEGNAAAAVLQSMGVAGVAYVVRPFGALIMGPLSDKLGRKFVLMMTLFLIGGATFAIGCLPTYGSVGMLAPILLILCRVVQGLSAAGEQASAISMSLEHARDDQRGLITSWSLQGTQAGSLLATAVFIPFTSFLSEDQLFAWGWRVPFWLSAFVVLAAYLIRRKLEEPPAFEKMEKEESVLDNAAPLAIVFRYHKAAILRVAICALVNTLNVAFTVWAISYATNGVGIPRSTMLWVPVVSNAVGLAVIPLSAMVSDRVGRKPVFAAGALLSGAMMFPFLSAVSHGNIPLIFVFGALMHGGFYSFSNATWPSFYAEMFPTKVRSTGLALGTQVGFALSGGFVPVIAAALNGQNMDNWVLPAIFVFVVGLCVTAVAMTAKETARRPLADIDNLHMSRTEALEVVRLDQKAKVTVQEAPRD